MREPDMHSGRHEDPRQADDRFKEDQYDRPVRDDQMAYQEPRARNQGKYDST